MTRSPRMLNQMVSQLPISIRFEELLSNLDFPFLFKDFFFNSELQSVY